MEAAGQYYGKNEADREGSDFSAGIVYFAIFFASDIVKKLDVNNYSFAHFTLILLVHYLMKCRRLRYCTIKTCISTHFAETGLIRWTGD